MNRAVGHVTRGTTATNRLRRFDRWIAHLAARAIRTADHPLAVDLGFGAHPATTLEWHRSLTRINPGVDVIGVEIDRARVAAARDTITAIHGGFEIPTTRRPLLIRAANVLRQYPGTEVEQAWRLMASRLAPDGWLVEGTCDEPGRLAALISIDSTGPQWLTISCRLAGLDEPSRVAARPNDPSSATARSATRWRTSRSRTPGMPITIPDDYDKQRSLFIMVRPA